MFGDSSSKLASLAPRLVFQSQLAIPSHHLTYNTTLLIMSLMQGPRFSKFHSHQAPPSQHFTHTRPLLLNISPTLGPSSSTFHSDQAPPPQHFTHTRPLLLIITLTLGPSSSIRFLSIDGSRLIRRSQMQRCNWTSIVCRLSQVRRIVQSRSPG